MPDLDVLPDGVVVAGADAVVTDANALACRMLDRDRGDVVGRHLREALPLDDLQGHQWFDCARPYDGLASRTGLAEQSWYTSAGDELMLAGRLVRARPRGPVDQVVLSLRLARARARADRERSDLVATVAHELRSPLTGVKGFTSTLLTKWERFSDEQRQLMLETVDSDADRLTRLITELLDAARIDSGRLTLRPALVDVPAVVARVLDSVGAGGASTVTAVVDDDVPRVWADSDRLFQVVTNLVENALRHGEGLGGVRVSPAGDGRDGTLVVVEDHGPGIDEDIRARVFTRFWKSGARGGSGLGLFIVAGIVDGHGGSVTIGEAEGGGARIEVWLPENEPESMRD